MTGTPHFSCSSAKGATSCKIALISRNFACAWSGAANMYSSTVFGFGLFIAGVEHNLIGQLNVVKLQVCLRYLDEAAFIIL